MKCRCAGAAAVGLLLFVLAPPTAQAQTLLTETTWGGVGSGSAEAVASAPDGRSYMAGITDSFTFDEFGNHRYVHVQSDGSE